MTDSYSKNYLKIYFWRFLSIITNFLSLMIVLPLISDNQELYGIYAFCISFSAYLSYADIGFLNAGQKFSAEEYSKGNRDEEMKILGFTAFVLLIMMIPFSIMMIVLSNNPEIIIKDLSSKGQEIAGYIFFIIGIFTPINMIIERLVQSILIIRIKDYISYRFNIISNIIKILSVFIFFNRDNYLLAEYFLFISLINIISSIVIMVIIKINENYDFIALIKSLRLTKRYYHLTKALAFSSLFSTLGYLIYYELDLIIIGQLYGPEEVAVYAIGFTFLNFFRTMWSSVFSPYAQRFNHFANEDSNHNIKKLLSNNIIYGMPLSFITITTLFLLADNIVILWVGEKYFESIIILRILMISTLFSFLTIPASHYFTAKLMHKYIYVLGALVPATFILSIFLLSPIMGINGIAVAKTIAVFISFIISIIGISKIINLFKIFKKWAIQLIILILLILPFLVENLSLLFSDHYKNPIQLLILLVLSGSLIALSYLAVLMTRKNSRIELTLFLNSLRN